MHLGFYRKRTVQRQPKTGGVLKSIATESIVKGDINGHIKGAHSKTETTTPIELLIYVPEGIAATEYQPDLWKTSPVTVRNSRELLCS